MSKYKSLKLLVQYLLFIGILMNTLFIPIYQNICFVSDQDIRWCPGCGDYSILKQVQSVMPELGITKEDIVFISGI
jgi:hypothetical protein